MSPEAVDEIIACLPQGRTLFHYFKDRYALLLLSMMIDGPSKISEVKSGPLGKLLSRPRVQEVLASSGSGEIDPDVLTNHWPVTDREALQTYRLTLGRWGSTKRSQSQQTTRKQMNLVLQLNFSNVHNERYEALLRPQEDDVFQSYGHPVAGGNIKTLAWSRLDVDLARGEALIEEIQTDWIRYADWALANAQSRANQGRDVEEYLRWQGLGSDLDALKTYANETLRVYRSTWDEAILAAAIWFLRVELGIRSIFYHDFVAGTKLKGIYGGVPPKSLYTTLPKKFCFRHGHPGPQLMYEMKTALHKKMRKQQEIVFWHLQL